MARRDSWRRLGVEDVPARLLCRDDEAWVSRWEVKDEYYRQYVAMCRRTWAVVEWARDVGMSETSAHRLVAEVRLTGRRSS